MIGAGLIGAGAVVCACSKPADHKGDSAAVDEGEVMTTSAPSPSQAPSASPRKSLSAPSSASSGAPNEGRSGDAMAAPDPVSSVEPDALSELLAAASALKPPPTTTGEEGGSSIGTETGEKKDKKKRSKKEKEEAAAAPSASASAAAGKPLISIGALSVQGDMASPSVERAARAQLYWPLVQRCRDKEGKILPPDAVLILFRIDEDGYIIASSISATPSKPELEDAAHCMRRELSVATFRAPPASRGMTTSITMTAPSVD